jgi:hypothetical protein
MRRPHPPPHFVFQDYANDSQPGVPGQLLDLRLQFFPHLRHPRRYLDQQLPLADDFKLLLGLVLRSLIGFLHCGSTLEKKFSNPNLSEFGREPLLPLFRFQLCAGQRPRTVVTHVVKGSDGAWMGCEKLRHEIEKMAGRTCEFRSRLVHSSGSCSHGEGGRD